MKEITLETKIADILNNYEGMKEILIDINPKFEKLNNPILRRTIAKVAGVKQAAIVGGMEPIELLNKLRLAVGQKPIENVEYNDEKSKNIDIPNWVTQQPKKQINANQILDEDKNPLVELHKTLKEISNAEVILIESDFKPEPLIEEMQKANHEVFCDEIDSEHFITYVKK